MPTKGIQYKQKSHHWPTPKGLYENLYSEFRLDFDPCPINSDFDGLSIPWSGKRVFCNPPYGRGVRHWLIKWIEAEISVYLLPARTDTKWFHEIVLPNSIEIRFIKGRLSYGDTGGKAPFPSLLAIFKGPAKHIQSLGKP